MPMATSTLGRWSDRITRAGETIYPRPIEELLQSDARIRFAAVVAVPDEAGEALPIAVVELFDGAVGDAAELERAYFAAGGDVRLGRVEVVAIMPMTPTGKLDKVALRLQFTA